MRACLCLAVVFAPAAHAGDYAAARTEALRTGKPLVVGVGCAAPAGDWITAQSWALDGCKAPCVVVSKDGAEWTATLSPWCSAEDVRSLLPRQGRKKWNPYDVPNFQRRMNR